MKKWSSVNWILTTYLTFNQCSDRITVLQYYVWQQHIHLHLRLTTPPPTRPTFNSNKPTSEQTNILFPSTVNSVRLQLPRDIEKNSHMVLKTFFFLFSWNLLNLKITNINICAPLTKKSSKKVAVENPHHSLNGSFELLLFRLLQFSAVLLQQPQGSGCVCSRGAERVKIF